MRFSTDFSRTRMTERLSALRVNKRLTAGIAATLLVTGAAGGTAAALTSGHGTAHPAAASAVGTRAATRATNDTASRSEQRPALDAQAAAKAKADAAAAQAKAQAAAKAAAATQAKAKADAQAKAKATAAAKAKAAAQTKARAAAAAKARAAATPTYANNLSGWIAEARAILAADGDKVPSANAIHARAMTESSGNPKAENHWDSNQALYGGTYGLVQTIKPTFARYSLPGHKDIMNPVDSIIAGVRYANATYGDFTKIAYTKSGY
jgi:hypothetical protein